MTFDALITAPCVNTPTTTTVSTTTVTTVSTTSTSTTSVSTGTTTCHDTQLAQVSPDVLSGNPSYFGAFGPGYYRVTYLYGAMKYAATESYWSLNRNFNTGFRLSYSGGLNVVEGPMVAYNAFPTQDQVEEFNAGANVEFYHAGGLIGMFLQDQPYDGVPSPTANPTFRLLSICNPPITTPTTTTVTTTSTTTVSTTSHTTVSTTTLSTTSTTTVNHACSSGSTYTLKIGAPASCSGCCTSLDAMNIGDTMYGFSDLALSACLGVTATDGGTFSHGAKVYQTALSSHTPASASYNAASFYDTVRIS